MPVTNELPHAVSISGLYRHQDKTFRVQFFSEEPRPGQTPGVVHELRLPVPAAVQLHAYLNAALTQLVKSGEISRLQ